MAGTSLCVGHPYALWEACTGPSSDRTPPSMTTLELSWHAFHDQACIWLATI